MSPYTSCRASRRRAGARSPAPCAGPGRTAGSTRRALQKQRTSSGQSDEAILLSACPGTVVHFVEESFNRTSLIFNDFGLREGNSIHWILRSLTGGPGHDLLRGPYRKQVLTARKLTVCGDRLVKVIDASPSQSECNIRHADVELLTKLD